MSTHDEDGRGPSTRTRQLRIREGRARVVGITVSAVLHIAVLVVYSGVAGPPTLSFTPRQTDGAPEITGLELLNLAEAEEPQEESEEEAPDETEILPEPEIVPFLPVEQEERAAADQEVQGTEVVAVTPAGPLGPPPAERLRIRTNDPRLWDFSEETFQPTVERMITAELAGAIDLWADSLAAALERDAAATDWTWTDAEGNRWGVSPGRLHLGSLTLPLPFNFGIAPGRFEEYMERQYVDRELSRNALTGLILETWRDRAEAIRARRDRERAERIEDSGPRRAVPDTTRRGG